MRRGAAIPTLEFDWRDEGIRLVADNIYHAQKAGWPEVLHYSKQKDTIARKKRYSAMRVDLEDVFGVPEMEELASDIEKHGALLVPTIRDFPSRDEYPFACTREHRGKVWVGHVPPEQNSRQGVMIREFVRKCGGVDGFEFRVRVIGRPEA